MFIREEHEENKIEFAEIKADTGGERKTACFKSGVENRSGEKKRREPEVLAPAGSYDSLRAAVAAGADAVYAGGTRFGARAFAHNFTEEALLEAIDYAHLHGCRFYLTVNTLLKDREIYELPDFLQPLYECGLDAVIVQDVGVLKVVRERFPELDIHASTQMTITGAYGANFLKQAGAVRVVPARELSLEEIRHLKEETGMEVECFVHGALCYCYSGQCLMSSLIGGRSGNRGQCAQPCRLSYQVGKESGHLLSMKDICTLEMIPELVEAGIDSFKIEGRMKRPEYVAGVTAAYRKYTDLYLRHGKKGFRVEEEDKERLLDLFNRGGFDNGYYKQKNGKEMLSVKLPGHAGVAAVKVLSQKGRELTGTALTDLSAGDILEFSTEDIGGGNVSTMQHSRQDDVTRLSQEEKRAWNYTLGSAAKKGERLQLLAPKRQKIAVGHILYRTRNQQLLDELSKTYVFGKKQEKVYGILNLSAGKPATLEVSCGDVRVEAQTLVNVELATSRPLTEEQIRRQLSKTKETEFVFESLDVKMDGALFLPMQQFNELRRNALSELERQICLSYHCDGGTKPRGEDETASYKSRTRNAIPFGNASIGQEGKTANFGGNMPRTCKVSVLVETKEQLNVVLNTPLVERIYLDFELFETEWRSICKRRDERDGMTSPRFYVALPHIARSQTVGHMARCYELLLDERIDGVLLRNYESVQFLMTRKYPGHMILDASLYVMNGQAASFWREQGIWDFTLPFELNYHELATREKNCDMESPNERDSGMKASKECGKDFDSGMKSDDRRGELVVYGRYPVMISAQCVQKTTTSCTHAGGRIWLSDRRKEKFPVRLYCSDCYNVIYNTKPLCLYDLSEELEKIAPEWVRFQFTMEGAVRTSEVLAQYERILNGVKEEMAYEYTRGHFHRGVT